MNTIIPNQNTLLKLAEPFVDDADKIKGILFTSIIAWQIEVAAKDSYATYPAIPVTIGGVMENDTYAIYNKFTTEWETDGAGIGKGEEDLLELFRSMRP